jgi:hypothetical protein
LDDEITQLLGDTDEESRFRRIGDLVLGRPDFGLSIARTLIESADSRQRTLGADIVGQAATVTKGVPESYVQLLRSRLDSETNPEALAAAIIALGHLGDPRARDGVGGKASHSDAEVRTAVAFSLPALGLTEETIAVLEGLTRDPETEVRDWATLTTRRYAPSSWSGQKIATKTSERREFMALRVATTGERPN